MDEPIESPIQAHAPPENYLIENFTVRLEDIANQLGTIRGQINGLAWEIARAPQPMPKIDTREDPA